MTTKEAQRAADAAWRRRLKESGGAHLSVTVSAEGLKALNALTGGDNRKRSKTVNAALIAAAKGAGRNSGNPEPKPKPDKAKSLAEKPRRGRGVHFNEAMAEVSSTKPKLDTSTVSIHPDLQKDRKK